MGWPATAERSGIFSHVTRADVESNVDAAHAPGYWGAVVCVCVCVCVFVCARARVCGDGGGGWGD